VEFELTLVVIAIGKLMLGGKLGKVKRLVIPSCVVKLIRDNFSEADGQYTEIKTVIESIRTRTSSFSIK
jgi:hypothetical protein